MSTGKIWFVRVEVLPDGSLNTRTVSVADVLAEAAAQFGISVAQPTSEPPPSQPAPSTQEEQEKDRLRQRVMKVGLENYMVVRGLTRAQWMGLLGETDAAAGQRLTNIINSNRRVSDELWNKFCELTSQQKESQS